ncbi:MULTISPECIES: TraK family protein [Enterobacteriaceae]|uniref:TraK family protein n=1 Tax=Enterobacteriaceae TaxID=543 RepID=UPI001F3F4663|nr:MULTISPECIES: TraK family protein [Enterobacteriaceae]MEB3743741.1 TraK family protein [Escherichia sp. Ec20190506]
MTLFSEYTKTELAALPDTIEPLTMLELRSVLLALGGDGFPPRSMYAEGLASATEKMERMLDEVRARLVRERSRRGGGRVAFLARLDEFRGLLEAGWTVTDIYENHGGADTGISYSQFSRYVGKYIRKPTEGEN